MSPVFVQESLFPGGAGFGRRYLGVLERVRSGRQSWREIGRTNHRQGPILGIERPNTPYAEQRECLLISRSAIDLPERPTAVVGRRPSGNSRVEGWRYCMG